VDHVPALLLKIDSFLADTAYKQNEWIEQLVEVSSMSLAVENVGTVVAANNIHSAALFHEDDALALRHVD